MRMAAISWARAGPRARRTRCTTRPSSGAEEPQGQYLARAKTPEDWLQPGRAAGGRYGKGGLGQCHERQRPARDPGAQSRRIVPCHSMKKLVGSLLVAAFALSAQASGL